MSELSARLVGRWNVSTGSSIAIHNYSPCLIHWSVYSANMTTKAPPGIDPRSRERGEGPQTETRLETVETCTMVLIPLHVQSIHTINILVLLSI